MNSSRSIQHIVMVGPFGLRPRMTMRMRALPLAKALVHRGYRVTMLLPPWQNPEDAGQVWVDDGVRIENMPLPHSLPGWFHVRLTAALARRTIALAPDVVHAFKPKAYAGLTHLALARRLPVVVDTDDWEGPGGWNEQGDYGPHLQRFFTWQERWGLRHADAVTVASRALQTLVWSLGKARKNVSAQRVFYLPNGVPTSAPIATMASAPAERPTVLLYTRFFEVDLDRLWRIMQGVRAQRAEVRFLVVGTGFDHEEDRLLALARRDGWQVAENADTTSSSEGYHIPDADLSYAGWGTPEKIEVCFSAADVAIYPFEDTLLNRTKCPVKLMELLAAGIPVVADAVGQLTEMIVPGKSGLLVQHGDAAAFSAAILSLLADRDTLARMSTTAHDDVTTRFAWKHLSAVAIKAYTCALFSHR